MIRWYDMIDPVYTLAALAGVDVETCDITGILIQDKRLIIYYNDENGKGHFVSKGFDLDV